MAAHNAIFLSYRRDDTGDVAGRMYDRLVAAFGETSVFKDVDSIPFGEDFEAYIKRTLANCRVSLILIGPQWLTLAAPDGAPRLHASVDYVRIEVEQSLKARDVQVIPILINGAEMPSADELPHSIQDLPRRNAAVVRRDPDFSRDMDRLIKGLREGVMTGTVVVEPAPATPAARQWLELERSTDIQDLRRFAESFPGTTEAFSARRRADQLQAEEQAWNAVRWNDEANVRAFIQAWPHHPRIADAVQHLRKLETESAEARAKAARDAAAREASEAHARALRELDHQVAMAQANRQQRIAASRRRMLMAVGSGVVLAGAGATAFSVWSANRKAEAEVRAQLAFLQRQSDELAEFLPPRLAGWALARRIPSGSPGASAHYTDPGNSGRMVEVSIQRHAYPDITESFTTRSGSYGLPNAQHAHETLQGLPAVLFTVRARESTAIFSVLVERNVEVKAAVGGELSNSIALARRLVSALPLSAIAEWARRQPPPVQVDATIASRLSGEKYNQEFRARLQELQATKAGGQ